MGHGKAMQGIASVYCTLGRLHRHWLVVPAMQELLYSGGFGVWAIPSAYGSYAAGSLWSWLAWQDGTNAAGMALFPEERAFAVTF